MCGGFVEDVGNAVSDVVSGAGDLLAQVDPGQALGDVVESIGNVVEPAIQGIGGAVEDVGRGISDVGVTLDEAVNQLPGGWTLPAAVATYFAAPYAAPLLAEALGGTALGAEAGALTTAELLGGAGGAFVPVEGASFSLPAALGAAGGAAAPAVTSAAAETAAQSVASSAKAAASAIAQSGSAGETLGLLSNPIIKSALTGGGYGALTGGVTSLLTGQDALKGALIGGATGGVLGGGEAAFLPELSKWAAGSVPNAGILGAGRGAVGGALNTAFGGGDLRQNIMYGGLGGGILGAGSEYFFPTVAAPTTKTSTGAFDTTAPEFAGATTPKPQQVIGGDMTQEIANMNLMNEYDRVYGLNRASNYEMADWVTRLNEIPLEQQRIALIDEGWDPEAVKVATMPKSEIESYLNKNTIDGASGIEAYDRARAIEMKYGSTIGEAGEAGINMPLYTDTPLDQQYINQDLQEGYASQYREPSTTPSSWYSGLGNLGTMLGAKALGGLGGGGAAARPMGASGSYVPKGMVDYSGILNLLAPKTSTRASLLG